METQGFPFSQSSRRTPALSDVSLLCELFSGIARSLFVSVYKQSFRICWLKCGRRGKQTVRNVNTQNKNNKKEEQQNMCTSTFNKEVKIEYIGLFIFVIVLEPTFSHSDSFLVTCFRIKLFLRKRGKPTRNLKFKQAAWTWVEQRVKPLVQKCTYTIWKK